MLKARDAGQLIQLVQHIPSRSFHADLYEAITCDASSRPAWLQDPNTALQLLPVR